MAKETASESVKITPSTLAVLKAIAERERRTQSAVMELAVELYRKASEKASGAKR